VVQSIDERQADGNSGSCWAFSALRRLVCWSSRLLGRPEIIIEPDDGRAW